MEINIKLVSGRLTGLEQSIRADGSIVFSKIKVTPSALELQPETYRSYGLTKSYNITVTTHREVVEAIYILRRLSEDYYQFISSTPEGTEEVKFRNLKALNGYIDEHIR